jgi:hypothetical protein
MPQAGSRVTDFQFDHIEGVTDFDFVNIDVGVMQRSERVTDFDFDDLDADVMQCLGRVTDFDFDDLDVGDMQHPTGVMD